MATCRDTRSTLLCIRQLAPMFGNNGGVRLDDGSIPVIRRLLANDSACEW